MLPIPPILMNSNNVKNFNVNNSEKELKQFQIKFNNDNLNSYKMNQKFHKRTRQISVNYPTFPVFNHLKNSNDIFNNDTDQSLKYKENPNSKNFENILKHSNDFNRKLFDSQIFTTRTRIPNINNNNFKPNWKSINTTTTTQFVNNSDQIDLFDRKINTSLEISPFNQQIVSSSNNPMGPQSALKNYRSQLTSLEQEEILNFSKIWFLGLNAKKTEAIKGASPNNGYDDESGAYIKVSNDHIAYRYEVLQTLGKGSFGQVFKALDHQTGQYVALKVIRNKKRFHQQSKVEVNILQHLRQKEKKSDYLFHVIYLLDSFFFRNHPCLVFELLGDNLYDVIKRNNFRGFSLTTVQKIAYSIFSCLSVLRKENIIHCDLKPENVLLINNNSTEIKIIDFGSSCFGHEKLYTYIQSRFYRSPEIILGIPYTTQIDIWSLGCMLPELLTGRPIFPGESEMDQLACIMEVFDLPPKSVFEESTRKRLFFDSKGEPRNIINMKGRKRVPNTQTIQSLMKTNTDSEFLDLIYNCLEWDANFRIQPDNALKHPWFCDYHPNKEAAKENQISERKYHPKRPRQRIAHKDKMNLNQSLEFDGYTQQNDHLPPIGINKIKQENSTKENIKFIEDLMINKTEFPSLYR